MTTKTYNVAGHALAVKYKEEGDSALLPSFAPFETEGQDTPLFTVEVDREFRLDGCKGKEVGQFDCGGADFGVYCTADGGYQYEVRSVEGTLCCVLQASPDFSYGHVGLVASVDSLCSYALSNSMMLMFTFATAPLKTLLMHSSVIRNSGRGFLFLGKSGTGKSTHTSLWRKYIPGSDLMNDDNPVLRVIDGKAVVYGSPWSGKTPCYRNISAPVGALVRLEQKPENKICREGVMGCLAALLPSASTMKWDRNVHGAILDTMQAVIASTPIYTLGCRPDEEAAQLSFNTICKG